MLEIIGGIIFILCGITVILDPISYNFTYSMTFDFSTIKWPLGIIFIAVGGYCIIDGAHSQRPKYKVKYWICPQCQKIFKLAGDKEHHCKECTTILEELDGFYDRHPELK